MCLLAQPCEPQEYSQTNSPPKSEIAIRNPTPYGQDARHMDLDLSYVLVVVDSVPCDSGRKKNGHDVRGDHRQKYYAIHEHTHNFRCWGMIQNYDLKGTPTEADALLANSLSSSVPSPIHPACNTSAMAPIGAVIWRPITVAVAVAVVRPVTVIVG